eukprot:4579131-Amphidinium_carterae.1
MSDSKLTVWKDFKAEVNIIKRTQANIGPLPMGCDYGGVHPCALGLPSAPLVVSLLAPLL